MCKYNRIEEATRNFIKVRDKLNAPETRVAFNLCWKKPYRFYREHSIDEAVQILKREAMSV